MRRATVERAKIAVLLIAISGLGSAYAKASQRELRVCADGNNLPFSNRKGLGFENKLAELVARELNAKLTYTWAAQRRGFIRNTLNAEQCDLIMGVPSAAESVLTTRPYYRSSYVFVSRPEAPRVDSLDAPQLRKMRIGVPLVGDDGANPAPLLALASRGLIANVRGYSVYGDYSLESPPAELLRALRRGDIDLAIAWGPLAGYYASRGTPRLRVTALREAEAPAGLSFAFDISMATRKGDRELLAELDRILERRQHSIAVLLARYSVPVVR